MRCLLPSSDIVTVISVGLGGCTRAAACNGLDEIRRRSLSCRRCVAVCAGGGGGTGG